MQRRLFVRRFLGVDVSSLTIAESERLMRDAQFARDLEVGVTAEAVAKVLAQAFRR